MAQSLRPSQTASFGFERVRSSFVLIPGVCALMETRWYQQFLSIVSIAESLNATSRIQARHRYQILDSFFAIGMPAHILLTL